MTSVGARPRTCLREGLVGACLLAFAGITAAPDASAETRGYVISMVHTATWANADACPQGDNGGLTALKVRRLVGRVASAKRRPGAFSPTASTRTATGCRSTSSRA